MIKQAAKKLFWSLPISSRRYLVKGGHLQKYGLLRGLPNSVSASLQKASLKPFYDNRCIFVHIPKSAGMSVTRSLFGGVTGNHLSLVEYQTLFSQREFEQSFKFTFVRNPWDRAVSAYCFLKKGGRNHGDLCWSQKYLLPYEDFGAFVKGWMTSKSVQSGRHFKPQHTYLCLPGKSEPAVDFIGRYETLTTDYQIVREKLGIGEALCSTNITKDREKDYRTYYTAETRAIVADVYRKDIELFGYDFDVAAAHQNPEISPLPSAKLLSASV